MFFLVGYFDSPALRAPPQEGDAYRTQTLRRFARPPFKGAEGIKTHLTFLIAKQALCPPKPKELEMAMSKSALIALLGV